MRKDVDEGIGEGKQRDGIRDCTMICSDHSLTLSC